VKISIRKKNEETRKIRKHKLEGDEQKLQKILR